MKRIGILTGLWLLLFLNCGQETIAQIQNKVCDTIPYEFIQEKIIIPVTVNGVNVKYIVDTGGRTGTMYDAATEMKATAAGYMRISDVNAQGSNYQEAHVQNISIGKNYKIKQLKTMVLPKNPFFTELGVVGILGGDAFAQSVVTFDSRSKIMVINYPYRTEKLKVTLLFAQRGIKVSEGNEDLTIKQNGIDIPVNLKYTIGLGSMAGIYLAAGPDFYFDFEKKSGIDKKKAQVGINVGAGLKLLNHLQVGANYNIPLGDTADIEGTDASYKTKTWQVSVAYIF